MLLLLTKDNAPCRVCLLRYPTDEFWILWAANVKLQLEDFFFGPTYLSAVTLSSSRPHLIVKSLYCFGLTTLIVSHHHDFLFFDYQMETWQKFVACLRREDPLYSQGKTAKVSFYVLSKSQSSFFPMILTFCTSLVHWGPWPIFSSINYDRWYFIMHLKKNWRLVCLSKFEESG